MLETMRTYSETVRLWGEALHPLRGCVRLISFCCDAELLKSEHAHGLLRVLTRTLASGAIAPGCAVLVPSAALSFQYDAMTDWNKWQQRGETVLWRAQTNAHADHQKGWAERSVSWRETGVSAGGAVSERLFTATAGLRIVNSSLSPGYKAYYCMIAKHTLTLTHKGDAGCVWASYSPRTWFICTISRRAPSLPLIITVSSQHHPLQILSELSVTAQRKWRPCSDWNVLELQQLNSLTVDLTNIETSLSEPNLWLL